MKMNFQFIDLPMQVKIPSCFLSNNEFLEKVCVEAQVFVGVQSVPSYGGPKSFIEVSNNLSHPKSILTF